MTTIILAHVLRIKNSDSIHKTLLDQCHINCTLIVQLMHLHYSFRSVGCACDLELMELSIITFHRLHNEELHGGKMTHIFSTYNNTQWNP